MGSWNEDDHRKGGLNRPNIPVKGVLEKEIDHKKGGLTLPTGKGGLKIYCIEGGLSQTNVLIKNVLKFGPMMKRGSEKTEKVVKDPSMTVSEKNMWSVHFHKELVYFKCTLLMGKYIVINPSPEGTLPGAPHVIIVVSTN